MLASLRKLQDGKVTITDKQIVLDCFAELVEAVLLSYAAAGARQREDRVPRRQRKGQAGPMGVASRSNWARPEMVVA